MNVHSFSFLFFLAVLLILGNTSYSQQKDSSYYYYNKMLHPAESSDIPLAIKFYTAQSEFFLLKNKRYEAINAFRMIGIGEYEIGNTYNSENALVRALALIDNSPKTDTLIESRKGLYNQLGKIYRASDQPDKALEAYNLALKFSRTSADSLTLLNNKATIYKDAENYEESLKLLESILKKKTKKYPFQLAMVLDNLGYVQAKLNMPDALSNLSRSLQIRDSLNDIMGLYSSNKNLALFYWERDNKQLAQSFANKAYNAAKSINSLTYLKDALSLFAIMVDEPKIDEFIKLSDSIENQKQLAQNKNAFLKYNVKKEQKNTLAAQLLREKEKSQKILYMTLGIFISILAVFIIWLLRIRHKKEKIQQVYNTETRISKKVHDEVANDVYQLMAKIQGKNADNEKLLDDLENIYNKTRDISKENSAIEIGSNFSELLQDLLLNYQNEKVSIVTRNIAKIEWDGISEIKRTAIYRVLQELMTNMKKYSEASVVVLTFQQNGKKLTIEYSDNGVGCTLKNKNGLQNAENRIHTINGTITFDSEPGKGFKSKIIV